MGTLPRSFAIRGASDSGALSAFCRPQIDLPSLVASTPFDEAQDLDMYLTRLSRLPAYIDQVSRALSAPSLLVATLCGILRDAIAVGVLPLTMTTLCACRSDGLSLRPAPELILRSCRLAAYAR